MASGHVAGLLLVLAVALPAPTSGQSADTAGTCTGDRISRVVIDNGDVFEATESDPKLLKWGYGIANLLHVRTTQPFIRHELLFKEGDCLDPFLIEESRRLLDQYGFVRDVRIDTEADGQGGTVVTVHTMDEWSTQIDVGVSYDAGLNLERFQATETNFLGTGVKAEFTRRHRREDRAVGVALSTPRLFGRTDASIGYGDSPGGRFFNQSVHYPFVGQAGRISTGEGYSRSTGFFSYVAGGDVSYSHILVPIFRESLDLGFATRFGEPTRSTILGVTVSRRVTRLNGLPEYVVGSDFEGSIPSQDELPEGVRRQIASRGTFRIGVHLARPRYRYAEYVGLDAVRDVQTVGIGYYTALSLGRDIRFTVPDSLPEVPTFGRFHTSFGHPVGQSLLHGGTTVEVGYGNGGWSDLLADADLVGYLRASWLPYQTWFFRASAGGGWRTTGPFQLALGGRDGVRSLPDDALPGGKRLLFVAENRIRMDWPDWGAVDLGLTLFADAGRVWAGDAPFGTDSSWQGSVGFGLRIGSPRGSRNIWRPDVVFPVGGGNRSPIFRVTYEVNRIRSGFFTGRVARSRRFTESY